MILIHTYLLLSYFNFCMKLKKNIDLQSDTVTNPSLEMKDYMLDTALGDDMFQDHPIVKELENKTARML